MSCARVDLKFIVAGGQRPRRSEKQKGHREGWPDCLLCLAPRVGFESTTCELTAVFLSHHWWKQSIKSAGYYTVFDVNMLRIDESSAESRAKGGQHHIF